MYFKLSYSHNAEPYDASQFITQTGYYQYFWLVLVQSSQRKEFCSTHVLILVYEVISGYKYLLSDLIK